MSGYWWIKDVSFIEEATIEDLGFSVNACIRSDPEWQPEGEILTWTTNGSRLWAQKMVRWAWHEGPGQPKHDKLRVVLD